MPGSIQYAGVNDRFLEQFSLWEEDYMRGSTH